MALSQIVDLNMWGRPVSSCRKANISILHYHSDSPPSDSRPPILVILILCFLSFAASFSSIQIPPPNRRFAAILIGRDTAPPIRTRKFTMNWLSLRQWRLNNFQINTQIRTDFCCDRKTWNVGHWLKSGREEWGSWVKTFLRNIIIRINGN